MNEIEYSVLNGLPNQDQIVMCYGHKTYCCSIDMDKEADWHKVKFHLHLSAYRLKNSIPEDPEESILAYYEVVENWECADEDDRSHVIGVTKWKKLAAQ